MKRTSHTLLGASLLLCLAWGAQAGENAVYERTGDDGAIELTNVPDGGGYHTVASAPAVTGSVPGLPQDESAIAGQAEAVAEAAAIAKKAAAGRRQAVSGGPLGSRLRALYDGAQAAHVAAGR